MPIAKTDRKPPRVLLNKKRGDQLFSAILILPTLLVTTIFILVPVIDSVIKSFLEFKVRNIISGKPGEWNNFENYIRLFNGGKLLPAIVITLSFVVGVVLVQFILGMALALILNSNVKCARFIRSIMMMPWVVPTIISALIWMWIFQPQYGLLKYFVGILTGGAGYLCMRLIKSKHPECGGAIGTTAGNAAGGLIFRSLHRYVSGK